MLTDYFFLLPFWLQLLPYPRTLLSVKAENYIYYLDMISSFPAENRDYDDYLL